VRRQVVDDEAFSEEEIVDVVPHCNKRTMDASDLAPEKN